MAIHQSSSDQRPPRPLPALDDADFLHWLHQVLELSYASSRTAPPVLFGESPPVLGVPPGHLCERCLDATAVATCGASWGGTMYACQDCAKHQAPDAHAEDARPVITFGPGRPIDRWQHARPLDGLRAQEEQYCSTDLPATVCTCGEFRIVMLP